MSVLEQRIRTVSALSVLPAYSLCSLYAVSVLPPRLDVRTLTVLHPSLSAAIRGKFGTICSSAIASVLARTLSVLSPPISANLNKIPYCVRTLYAKFHPYSIHCDPQHPCVGVKRALKLVHTVNTAKTKLSCVVRVGGVNTIADKARQFCLVSTQFQFPSFLVILNIFETEQLQIGK